FWRLAAWVLLAMTIKRLNDLNLPALAAIGLFFPMVSILFVILLMALPGFDQTNEHGPPPFPKK
ncbi:MAG: DUF805 domain-containing protein, partial [Rhizobiaceae bacterium]|nr:DUF805 domain-containing protein [Rhizobiaceae bacterium]